VANTPQARKRARQNTTRRAHNATLRSNVRTHIKKVISLIKEGNKAAAAIGLNSAVSVIDRMVNKGIMHKNKAARLKSRLNAQIKKLK